MRRSRELARLREAMFDRTRRLGAQASTIAGSDDSRARELAAHLAIETYSAWANFGREFFMSCAFMKARQLNGARVANSNTQVVDEYSALIDAIPRVKGKGGVIPSDGKPIPPGFEPDWSRRDTLIKLADTFSNKETVLNGLSLQTTFFDHLPTVRIFYAHRTKTTAEKVQKLALREYGISDINHPTALVNGLPAGRTQTLLSEWLADIQTVVDGVCA